MTYKHEIIALADRYGKRTRTGVEFDEDGIILLANDIIERTSTWFDENKIPLESAAAAAIIRTMKIKP